jgi:uridine phosphorylase
VGSRYALIRPSVKAIVAAHILGGIMETSTLRHLSQATGWKCSACLLTLSRTFAKAYPSEAFVSNTFEKIDKQRESQLFDHLRLSCALLGDIKAEANSLQNAGTSQNGL